MERIALRTNEIRYDAGGHWTEFLNVFCAYKADENLGELAVVRVGNMPFELEGRPTQRRPPRSSSVGFAFLALPVALSFAALGGPEARRRSVDVM